MKNLETYATEVAAEINNGVLNIQQLSDGWKAPSYCTDWRRTRIGNGPADLKEIFFGLAKRLNPEFKDELVTKIGELYLTKQYMNQFHGCMKGEIYEDYCALHEIVSEIGNIPQLTLMFEHSLRLIGDTAPEQNVIYFEHVQGELERLEKALRKRGISFPSLDEKSKQYPKYNQSESYFREMLEELKKP